MSEPIEPDAPLRAPDWRRVVAAGALAALVDAVYGIVYFVGILRVISVDQFFLSIAAGLLGRASYQGGLPTAALGASLHLGIGVIWAPLYRLALSRPNDLDAGRQPGRRTTPPRAPGEPPRGRRPASTGEVPFAKGPLRATSL